MKRYYIFALVILSILSSCGKQLEDEQTTDRQIERIDKYVASSKFTFSNEEVGFYKASRNKVAKIGDKAEKGDSIYIYFAEFTFYSSIDDLVFTNMKSVVDELQLDGTGIDYNPLALKVGDTDVISGLMKGIENSIAGDSIQLIFTSDYAYGDRAVGSVPPYTSIAINVEIDRVVKQ